MNYTAQFYSVTSAAFVVASAQLIANFVAPSQGSSAPRPTSGQLFPRP